VEGPNAGKSTIFNKLLTFDRAIVTEVPGTTRDTLSETVNLAGVPVILTDTAGLRDAESIVESIGLERTKEAMADADLLLVVLDGSSRLGPSDWEIVEISAGRPRLMVLNKSDLPTFNNEFDKVMWSELEVVEVSAKFEGGLGKLQEAIIAPFESLDSSEAGLLITDARHYDLLCRARSELKSAASLIRNGSTEELVATELHNGLRFLGAITGETTTEEVLSQVFATFCIGK